MCGIYSLIVLTSVTAAKRVEKAANDYFLHCSTMRTPKTLSNHGCSYSVKVKSENLRQTFSIAEKMGLKIYGVFNELKEAGKINYVKVDMK
ncbi:MAG: DUF3343 domain-containing protein [Clostridia bacterium]|nr:DUF3343 domain-containing protein [Clostridia bacterium]